MYSAGCWVDSCCTVPLSNIEAAIQTVMCNCYLNGIELLLKKRKAVVKRQPTGNRGLINEICRKYGCTPEVIKYVLLSKDFNQDRCRCVFKDPNSRSSKIPPVPFTQFPARKPKTDIYGNDVNDMEMINFMNKLTAYTPKTKKNEFNKKWLKDFNKMYSSVAGLDKNPTNQTINKPQESIESLEPTNQIEVSKSDFNISVDQSLLNKKDISKKGHEKWSRNSTGRQFKRRTSEWKLKQSIGSIGNGKDRSRTSYQATKDMDNPSKKRNMHGGHVHLDPNIYSDHDDNPQHSFMNLKNLRTSIVYSDSRKSWRASSANIHGLMDADVNEKEQVGGDAEKRQREGYATEKIRGSPVPKKNFLSKRLSGSDSHPIASKVQHF